MTGSRRSGRKQSSSSGLASISHRMQRLAIFLSSADSDGPAGRWMMMVWFTGTMAISVRPTMFSELAYGDTCGVSDAICDAICGGAAGRRRRRRESAAGRACGLGAGRACGLGRHAGQVWGPLTCARGW